MEENQGQSQVFTEGKKRRFTLLGNKKSLLVIVIVLVVVTGVAIAQLTRGRDESPAVTDNTPNNSAKAEQDNEVRDATTITSQAGMLKIVLGIFKTGGTVNDASVAARGFYPSTVDMKDASWLKENMQIEADTHELIESGEIVYEPKGCNADQPSGEDNKCNGFILRVDGKVVAEEQ